MSVFSAYVSSLRRAGAYGSNEEITGALVAHIAPNSMLLSAMQTKSLIGAAVKATEGPDRAEGYRLLCILLDSAVYLEESKLAVIFERLPALVESISGEEEEEHLLSLVELVYSKNLAATIERIEKILIKLIGTVIRLIQNRKNRSLSLRLLSLLISSKSRSSIQPQVYNNIRKACITVLLDDYNTMRLAARTIALCNSAEAADFWQNEFSLYCHDLLLTATEIGISCDITDYISINDKSISIFRQFMTHKQTGAGQALKLEALFSAVIEVLWQVYKYVCVCVCVCFSFVFDS